MIINKNFQVEVAHRLKYSYTKRCQGVHGHSYVFGIYLHGKEQDDAQMLMDFSLVKEKFHNFIDSFDHALLVWQEDTELAEVAAMLNPRHIILPYNTTSEQIARHIYYQGIKLGLPMHKVTVSETPSSCAQFSGDDPITIDLDQVVFSQAIIDSWK